tara:strand:- start:19967 stop:20167 length:201 start_codon:yes stop_codon:yes gene_type:complete
MRAGECFGISFVYIAIPSKTQHTWLIVSIRRKKCQKIQKKNGLPKKQKIKRDVDIHRGTVVATYLL